MKVKFFGTRGSIPICNPLSMRYGGNTTCLRVMSDCIPEGWALVIDTGSGYMPLSLELLKEKIMNVAIIYTHWHHDHTQGLFLAAHTFITSAKARVWGPKENSTGPKEIFSDVMRSPVFPVDFRRVAHRFEMNPLMSIGTEVLVVHKLGGFCLMPIHKYRDCCYNSKQVHLENGSYPVNDCLVIFMYKTDHPEYSISYRFQEKPTDRSFVFLTDHENTASLSSDLLTHVKGADLLVQDSQYSEQIYRGRTGGYGHGTPEYCAELMCAANAKRLGLTHHDPSSTDEDVDNRLIEAISKAKSLGAVDAENKIFACADYMEVEV